MIVLGISLPETLCRSYKKFGVAVSKDDGPVSDMGILKKYRSFELISKQVAGDGTQTKKGSPGVCRGGSGKNQAPMP